MLQELCFPVEPEELLWHEGLKDIDHEDSVLRNTLHKLAPHKMFTTTSDRFYDRRSRIRFFNEGIYNKVTIWEWVAKVEVLSLNGAPYIMFLQGILSKRTYW